MLISWAITKGVLLNTIDCDKKLGKMDLTFNSKKQKLSAVKSFTKIYTMKSIKKWA